MRGGSLECRYKVGPSIRIFRANPVDVYKCLAGSWNGTVAKWYCDEAQQRALEPPEVWIGMPLERHNKAMLSSLWVTADAYDLGAHRNVVLLEVNFVVLTSFHSHDDRRLGSAKRMEQPGRRKTRDRPLRSSLPDIYLRSAMATRHEACLEILGGATYEVRKDVATVCA